MKENVPYKMKIQVSCVNGEDIVNGLSPLQIYKTNYKMNGVFKSKI